jgi:hypothetical protein
MAGRRSVSIVLSGVQAGGVISIVCLLSCAPAVAQTAAPATAPQQQQLPPPPSAPTIRVDALPISVDRIAEQLQHPPVLQLAINGPIFRVRIFGARPRWLGDIDWLGVAEGGKPPVGTPWRDQYLNMVTPPEARSFGAFTGTDLLQVVATSFAQGAATGAIVGKVKEALHDRRERQAREEVDAAIAAWKKEREAAAAKEHDSPLHEAPPP